MKTQEYLKIIKTNDAEASIRRWVANATTKTYQKQIPNYYPNRSSYMAKFIVLYEKNTTNIIAILDLDMENHFNIGERYIRLYISNDYTHKAFGGDPLNLTQIRMAQQIFASGLQKRGLSENMEIYSSVLSETILNNYMPYIKKHGRYRLQEN